MTSPAMCSWDPASGAVPTWAAVDVLSITDRKKLAGRRVGPIEFLPHAEWSTQEERFHSLAAEFASRVLPGDRLLMEGYAMGARGRVFHIGECAGVLKNYLWKKGVEPLVAAPTEIKKHATGKGNADKAAMVGAMRDRHGVDLMELLGVGCGSPASDVADAFHALTVLTHSLGYRI